MRKTPLIPKGQREGAFIRTQRQSAGWRGLAWQELRISFLGCSLPSLALQGGSWGKKDSVSFFLPSLAGASILLNLTGSQRCRCLLVRSIEVTSLRDRAGWRRVETGQGCTVEDNQLKDQRSLQQVISRTCRISSFISQIFLDLLILFVLKIIFELYIFHCLGPFSVFVGFCCRRRL